MRGSASEAARLTVSPGAEVRFVSGTGLMIGYGSYKGALLAQGTDVAPIVFTSDAAAPAPGDWKGIYFGDAADDALSVLEHCVVEYGGASYNATSIATRLPLPFSSTPSATAATRGSTYTAKAPTTRSSPATTSRTTRTASTWPAAPQQRYSATTSSEIRPAAFTIPAAARCMPKTTGGATTRGPVMQVTPYPGM